MLAATIHLLTVMVCWFNVASKEVPVITRDTYDIIRFSNCSGYSHEQFSCGYVLRMAVRFGDERTCTCQCEEGFVTYRDPFVNYNKGKYLYQKDNRGCVWYGHYEEGCSTFRSLSTEIYHSNHNQKFKRPIVIDMTQSGNVTLQAQHSFNDRARCLKVEPYVRIPGKNQWTRIGIRFQLEKTFSNRRYSLQWESNSSDIYSYQGLVMRLEVSKCKQKFKKRYCIMAKIAGTYTGLTDCKRRTTSGRCCVFPFEHEGDLHNDCISTKDNEGPWCAVSLNTEINEGNHKWRENCVDSTVIVRATAQVSEQNITTQRTPIKPEKTPRRNVTVNAKETSSKTSSQGFNTLIVAMVAGLMVLLIVVVIAAVYLRHRKTTRKKPPGPRTSNDGFTDDGAYASLRKDTRPDARNSPNCNFYNSIEQSGEEPSILGRGIHGDNQKHRVNMPLNTANLYDTVAEDKSENPPSLIYNVPEVGYSSTAQLPKTKTRNLPPTDDPSNHIYAVLEPDSDPEPVYDDDVFVKDNGFHQTNYLRERKDQSQPDLSVRIYDEPMEMTSSQNVYDLPDVTDRGK